MKGQGEKGRKRVKKGGEGEEKEKKMEEISLNGGEGFQEASWGWGMFSKNLKNIHPWWGVFKRFLWRKSKSTRVLFAGGWLGGWVPAMKTPFFQKVPSKRG